MKDHLKLDRSRLLGFKITSEAQSQPCDPRIGAKIGDGKPVPEIKSASAKESA